MNKYLITGGAGFIGSHISEFLSSEGHEVVFYLFKNICCIFANN